MTTHFPRCHIRLALPSDVDAIFKVRTSVRENALTADELIQIGVTPASIAQTISATPCVWVAEIDSEVIGFSMVEQDNACLFAAFVLPEHEGKGIGTRLIQISEHALFKHHDVAWLETAEGSRAARLYRHLGWGNPKDIGNGDVRLEKRRV